MLFKIWNSLEKSAFVTVGHFVDVHNMHCNDNSFSIVTYPSEVHSNTAKQNDCSHKLTVNMVHQSSCTAVQKMIISEHCSVF